MSTNYQGLAVIVSLLGIVGGGAYFIGELRGDIRALQGDGGELRGDIRALQGDGALRRIESTAAKALADVEAAAAPWRLRFGEWQSRELRDTYHAQTDGFVLTSTSGRGDVAVVEVWAGSTVATMTKRSRTSQLADVTTPVRQGEYYQVRLISGTPLTVDTCWLPLTSVRF